MHPIIISAPFGNYLRWPGVTSTVGTYTMRRRAGPLRRLWRLLTTVRYWPRTGAWVNRMGLPSPGINAMSVGTIQDKIVSIHGFDISEWDQLARILAYAQPLAVELNVSCPNIEDRGLPLAGPCRAATILRDWDVHVIAKLSPVDPLRYGSILYDHGVRAFHLCNTIPTPGGGMGGKPLKPFALWAIREFRATWKSVTLIGGGGVTELEDVEDYIKAGANHVAVGSMLFNPLKWRKIPLFRDSAKALLGDQHATSTTFDSAADRSAT